MKLNKGDVLKNVVTNVDCLISDIKMGKYYITWYWLQPTTPLTYKTHTYDYDLDELVIQLNVEVAIKHKHNTNSIIYNWIPQHRFVYLY